MTPREAAAILRRHNEWRRWEGDDAPEMLPPKLIGESLTPNVMQLRMAELERDAALAIAGKAGNTVLLNGAQPLVSIGK